MILALLSDWCTDMWKIAVKHQGRFWIGCARVQFKSPTVAKHLAFQPIYDPKNLQLQIRSCMFGQHEKPVHLGRTGSIIVVYNIRGKAAQQNVLQRDVRNFFERFGFVDYVHLGKFAFVERCLLS